MSTTQLARNSTPSTDAIAKAGDQPNMTTGESTQAPSLLEWMGHVCGGAIERALQKTPSLSGTPFDTLIQALPAAIYTTDAAGRITFLTRLPQRCGVAGPS